MKKKLIVLLCVITMLFGFTGCSNYTTQYLGNDMTIHLEPNNKLVHITWKDSGLWFLTKPMTEDDVAETYLFQQKSEWGVYEGTVTVIESKDDSDLND